MPKAEFTKLVEKLSPTISRNHTRPVGSSESVDTRIMVAITMRFLSGGQPLDLGWPYGIADSTVYMVIDDTIASMDVMLDKIKFPQTEYDCMHEAAAFQRLCRSPFCGIIAAMDGIAIAITCHRLSCCPDPRKYYYRKGGFAISVQACVSASYKITFVSAMHAGSTHDSTALLSTSFHAHLLKKEEEGSLPSWARVAADNACGNSVAGVRVITRTLDA
jgi:DDE superfamily endonuclease